MAIGMSPDTVKSLSIWEFFAAVDGYVKANTPDDGTLSDADVEALWPLVEDNAPRKSVKNGKRH